MSATNNDIIRLMDSQLKTLRLENARLAIRLNVIRDILNAAGSWKFETFGRIVTVLNEPQSTALAEFLGPTIKLLKEVEREIAIHYDESDLEDIRNELTRLASAIGGGK